MPKAITKEDREKIIKHKQNNKKEQEIADWLLISKSSVTKIWSLFQKTGSVENKYNNCGVKSSLSVDEISAIKQEIKDNPSTTINELIEKLNLPIGESGLSKVLKNLGLSFKKRLLTQPNKNELIYNKKESNGKKISKI